MDELLPMTDISTRSGKESATSEEGQRLACEEARRLVGADPADEKSAVRLAEAVRLYAGQEPKGRRGLPPIAPAVQEARRLIAGGALENAEILLRRHLGGARNDPAAMHSMGEIAARCGFREDAERIFKRSADLHAGSSDARADLGMTLHRIACEKDWPEFIVEAVAALDEAIKLDPAFEAALAYKAAILVQTRALDQGRAAYERLLDLDPHVSAHWMNYAYLLKTVGEFGASVAAYRTAVALDPMNGAAWWGLANLKLARFFREDLERMRESLRRDDLAETSRVEINFALARALDQAGSYDEAARQLTDGNGLRWATQPRDDNVVTGDFEFVSRTFTRPFFESRKDWGDKTPGPIFIVGMPRAGSTLVEQILASHPAIEGTEELFVLLQLAGELAGSHPGKDPAQLVRGLSEQDFEALGVRDLDLAARSRRTDRPFFTDKNPYNWRYTGLIHAMLPNAKIVDVRRNPMDCCFANYAQHFQVGANFSYDQRALGQFYDDYVRTMRHFDQMLPGRIHRVIHEDLVDNFETEVRRLLDYLGLPFDERCLRYYETERPVHTPSSEQVRQPINRSGLGKWRHYERHLGPLIESLGDLPRTYRA
jgi:tetratricopeptide (TPR) repeat protein